MNFIIKQEILLQHLHFVIRGISNKNLIPILNCIKFELKSEGLYLISTDNDLAIKTYIPKQKIEKIGKLGEIVVYGKYIYDIIKKLPNELINIEEVVDSKLYIYTNNSSFHLNCNNANEFPNLEIEENKVPIILNRVVLKNIIDQTIFATSNQESRPILTGLNIKIENNILQCTATDSYRLAKKTIKLENSVDELINIVIPTKNINEVNKLLNISEDDIELHIFNNKVIFKFDNLIILSRLITGTYPDTSNLIPNEFLLKVKVNLIEFYNAIDRASLLTNEADKNTIKLKIKNNEIIISSNIPEIGNVEEMINGQKNNNEEISIAFSSKYMLDALKSFHCEIIEIMFNGEIKPIIIKDKDDENLIQLVLPIRTY